MHSLDPIPAVRRIETDRADACAFEIAGHVTGADVENLYGLLDGAYALHDRVDLLIRMVDHDGVDWDTIASSTTAEGERQAARHVRRFAAIGEERWTSHLKRFFRPPAPAEMKRFGLDEEGEAWAWIGARPVQSDI